MRGKTQTMKLLTHNLLMCNAKKCGQYPLQLNAEKTEELEVEYNEDFVKGILPKLDYPVIVEQARRLNIGLPLTIEEVDLKLLHKVLLGIEVVDGNMTCEKCSHIFSISDGIPNMLLNPSEV